MSSAVITELRSRLARLPLAARGPVRSTGISAFDAVLPSRGWQGATLVEWLADPGSGAVELAYRSLRPLLASNGLLCVIDPARTCFPRRTLVEPQVRCLVLHPQPGHETWWATEEVLRCPGVAVTWCFLDAIPERVLRRWQLAAEAGGGLGMLFRPQTMPQQRSWCDLRLSVTPVPNSSRTSRTVRVQVVSCRGRLGGQAVMLELHHAPDTRDLVSALDGPTPTAKRPRFTLPLAGCVG